MPSFASGGWQRASIAKNRLGIGIGNPYFILRPHFKLVYRNRTEIDTVVVLNEIKNIDGVRTRVVEDRVTLNGKLSELTRDFYAEDRVSHDVYYLGEDVNEYRDGKLVGHSGSWRSGQKGAHFGLVMPANARVGMRFYQEYARHSGMDRAEIIAIDSVASTAAGTFLGCIMMRETNPLEPSAIEIKYYAPNIGVVKDADSQLIYHSS